MTDRARGTRRLAIAAWFLLAGSVAAWAFVDAAGIGLVTATIAFLPLLLPVTGLLRGSPRSYRLAALTLAPALALALTELLVNVPSRPFTIATLALILLAFASLVAALRAASTQD
jgi:uncharacterized membrane protein